MKSADTSKDSGKAAGTLTAKYDVHGDYSSKANQPTSPTVGGQTSTSTTNKQGAASSQSGQKIQTSQYDANEDYTSKS